MKIDRPWQLMTTPNQNEFGFKTIHDPDKLAWFTTEGNNGRPIEGVTLYKDWILREPKRADATYGGIWGDYVRTQSETGPGGEIIYNWNKYKNDTDKYTPYQDPIPSSKPFGWDPVLVELTPIADYNNPRSGNKLIGGVNGNSNGPEYYAHIKMIAGGEYATRFLRYDYFAATPFKIAAKDTPVPTAVVLMLPGREAIMIPRCLHKRIATGRIITNFAQAIDGESTAAGGSIPGVVYPSTSPFEEWGQIVVEQDQRRESGGWHMWKIIAFPPAAPPVTEQNFS